MPHQQEQVNWKKNSLFVSLVSFSSWIHPPLQVLSATTQMDVCLGRVDRGGYKGTQGCLGTWWCVLGYQNTPSASFIELSFGPDASPFAAISSLVTWGGWGVGNFHVHWYSGGITGAANPLKSREAVSSCFPLELIPVQICSWTTVQWLMQQLYLDQLQYCAQDFCIYSIFTEPNRI